MWTWTTKPVIRVNFFNDYYASSESWIDKLSIDVWCVRIEYLAIDYWLNYLNIWNLRVQKKSKFEKIAFENEVLIFNEVQIKFLLLTYY